MSKRAATIVFAGGGTGGHIFPNVAIRERLRRDLPDVNAHFVVSQRAVDRDILNKTDTAWTAVAAAPFSARPWRWPGFAMSWRRAMRTIHALFAEHDVRAVVATGGFVSAPVVVAASRMGLPVALVNLDAVPGRANRWLAGRADALFSVYPVSGWPKAQVIGMPLRESAVSNFSKSEARRALGLDVDRPTLLVMGGSQGATSINALMLAATEQPQSRAALANWQVFHLAGSGAAEALAKAYERAGIVATVVAFHDAMGLAWRAGDLAITRAGASTCAEAWANACPSIMLPYPYHRDEHQRLNAGPLVEAGGAILIQDQVDAAQNLAHIGLPMRELLAEGDRRERMSQALDRSKPPDGAAAIARWVAARLDERKTENQASL